jgi:hypothetical protein
MLDKLNANYQLTPDSVEVSHHGSSMTAKRRNANRSHGVAARATPTTSSPKKIAWLNALLSLYMALEPGLCRCSELVASQSLRKKKKTLNQQPSERQK